VVRLRNVNEIRLELREVYFRGGKSRCGAIGKLKNKPSRLQERIASDSSLAGNARKESVAVMCTLQRGVKF
jgi:hypothetical protein